MDIMKDGWFTEEGELWPGQCLSLQADKVLFKEKSSFQDVLIFESKSKGRVLVLDGVIQLTENDEFSYQEMLSFLPVYSHPNPEKVLVIGGGDGGILRELDKCPLVKKTILCEIDEMVITASKQYLPFMSKGFDSKKCEVHIADGLEFMRQHKGEFDIIITDSSDPVGPASTLFNKEYYKLMFEALKDDGIVSSQGESMWLHLDLIRDMQDYCRQIFPVVEYASFYIPTYPSGQIGCLLCSKNPETNFCEPLHVPTPEELDSMQLRYYSPEIHRSSFVLPRFVQKALTSPQKQNGNSNKN